jgi:hypothetical protein
MDIEAIFKDAVVRFLGFAPVSNAIKPVHLANGLARAVAGGYGDVAPLQEVLRTKVAGHPPRLPLSSSDLRQQVPAFQGCPDDVVSQIRMALYEVCNADSGVYASANFSSYTLSHRKFATNDRSDQDTGSLIYEILARDLGNGSNVAYAALKHALGADDTDEMTTACFPLLDPKWVTKPPPSPSLKSLSQLATGKRPSHMVRRLRDGMDRLASNKDTSKLVLLRRIVLLASIGIHFHLVQFLAELDKRRRAPDDFTPILLDVTGDIHSSVAEASRDSFTAAMHAVDDLVRYLLALELEKRWGSFNDGRVVRRILRDIGDSNVTGAYDGYRDDGLEAGEALQEAAFDALMATMSGTPNEFARYLAMRAGLVAPRIGRGRKGYQASLELLEILTLSSVPSGSILSVQELLDYWWSSFGLLVGGRPSDLALLGRVGINRITQDDLDENTEQLVEVLEQQGLARRYGDGVRQIGRF